MLKSSMALSAILCLLLNGSLHAYESDPQTLVLQKQYLNQINQCATPNAFARLINDAMRASNQAQKAQLAMAIEEMILQNPSCFVEASIKIGRSKCEWIEAMFIQEPHFNPRENLKQSLSNARLYPQSCFAS